MPTLTLQHWRRKPINFIRVPLQLLRDIGIRLGLRSLRILGFGHLLFGPPVWAEQDSSIASNFTLLHPAETIHFSDPGHELFLRNCQFMEAGKLDRPSIFVCQLHNARLFPEIGLVFDRQWRPIVESILDLYRLSNFTRHLPPRRLLQRPGTFSSIQHLWPYNNWHWTLDSLPQILSLERFMQGKPLTLLMSNALGDVQRLSLQAILPPNFTVEYVDPLQWLELETFILPSHVSCRCNGFLPAEYYDFIRTRTFQHFNIPKPAAATARYYISRASAKHRRVTNEIELAPILDEFGFQHILMEDYTFPQQIQLFRGAEAVISPHGAALGGIMYADSLKVCVLYSAPNPGGYFYTLARGLGHQHFYLTGTGGDDDDFPVDPAALRNIISQQMKLAPITTS